jgi:hypothetical protein
MDGALEHVQHPELTRRPVNPRHDEVVLEDYQICCLTITPENDGNQTLCGKNIIACIDFLKIK